MSKTKFLWLPQRYNGKWYWLQTVQITYRWGIRLVSYSTLEYCVFDWIIEDLRDVV